MNRRAIRWLVVAGLVVLLALGVVLAIPGSRAAFLGLFRRQAVGQTPVDETRPYHGKTLDEWLEDLDSGDSKKQHGACFAFQYFKAEDAAVAVPRLIGLLKSRDPHLRGGAAYALGRIGPFAREALLPLTALLSDEKANIRPRAAEAIDRMSGPEAKEAVPALTAALKDAVEHLAGDEEARQLRTHLARALGKVGPEARPAVAPLGKLLEDRNVYGRTAAAEALGLIGPDARAAGPALTARLQDSDSTVRIQAALALFRVEQSPKAVPVLVGIFDNDKKPRARIQAAQALGDIGPAAKEAVPSLREAALNDTTQGVMGRFEVRRAAQEALKKIDPNAVGPAGVT
jgi:HEAT repeat protein